MQSTPSPHLDEESSSSPEASVPASSTKNANSTTINVNNTNNATQHTTNATMMNNRTARSQCSSSSVSPPASAPPSWTLDDFEFGKQIGEGRFGTVYLAREKKSGYKVAIKAVRKDDVIRLDMRHQLEREVRLQKYASRHPHVLALYAYFWDKKFVYIVMEYCDGGDLGGYASMRSPRRHLVDESLVACWTRQLLEAVNFLHEHRLLHRDIKPENILLKRGRVKLGDFTWCVSLQQEPPFDRRRTICGTLDYLSPELVSHMPYDQQLDVWSVGVVAYELLVGVPPFEHPRPVDTCLCIQRGEFTIPPDSMSTLAQDFLKSVLVVEPSERPSCKELLKHAWIETAPPTPESSSKKRRRQQKQQQQQQSVVLPVVGRGDSLQQQHYHHNNNTNTPHNNIDDDDDVSRALELSGIQGGGEEEVEDATNVNNTDMLQSSSTAQQHVSRASTAAPSSDHGGNNSR